MQLTQAPAPGSRALIRDEEWLIQHADPCEQGGWQLSCIGVSETVRKQHALFLSALESVTLIDPAKTRLVFDRSPSFMDARLAIEARLRQSAVQGDALALGHRGVMDVMPFQLLPTQRVLQQLRPRLLIADTVGLGKTLEAGILSAELIRRGRVRRMLVVTTKSMMRQFQEEFWNRFTVALTRLDSAGIQRIRREIPTNHNPFNYFDRSIISVDTLKRDSEYRHYLEKAWWDLIIIDEAHNVSYKGNRTQSNRLAKLLAQRSDALILLTATPHNGKKESFASLMDMLDPTAIPPGADYSRSQVEHLFIRRFKNDVRDQMKKAFPERRVYQLYTEASAVENKAFSVLAELKKQERRLGASSEGQVGDGAILFSTLLEKALFSSPEACLKTLSERIKRLEKKDVDHPDLMGLRKLHEQVGAIGAAQFSKFQYLVKLLKGHSSNEKVKDETKQLFDPTETADALPKDWKWDGKDANDRLVIFTERIDTLRFLEKHLPEALKLKSDAVAVLHGQMGDEAIQEIVDGFGRTHSPFRLLIASDVASEGLNLHHRAHRLIHFDIPWSLMVFQQRNGRVDRYGQSMSPMIGYLYTKPEQEAIRGDIRYLEILIEKDEQAARNIGDPSAFMGLYDEEEEVKRVALDMQSGKPADEFAAELEDQSTDLLSALFGVSEEIPVSSHSPNPEETPPVTKPADRSDGTQHVYADNSFPGNGNAHSIDLPSLFGSDFEYAQAGLQRLREYDAKLQRDVEFDQSSQTVRFQPGADLQRILERELADEMWPDNNTFVLSADRRLIDKAVADSRDGDSWPALQYLWPLHPVMQWLDYKLMAGFGRQRAPVMRVAQGLKADEAIVLVMAQIPNRRGQAMVVEWIGICLDNAASVTKILDLQDCLRRVGLEGASYQLIANDPDAPIPDLSVWQNALPRAVKAAEQHVKVLKQRFDQTYAHRLDQELKKLGTQMNQHQHQLQLELERGGLEQVRLSRRERRAHEIDQLFQQYRAWARETLKLDDRPQLSVVAVLVA